MEKMMGLNLLRDLHALYSPSQMRGAIQRERLRVDRNDGQMSVAVFEIPAGTWWQLRRMARIVLKRCRSTDEAGWMSARTIGVILTDTGSGGAWACAGAVQEQGARYGLKVNHSIYTYPDQQQPPRNRDRFRLAPTRQPRELATISPDAERRSAVNLHRRAMLDDSINPAMKLQVLLSEPLPIWKRAMDITGAMLGLVIAAPLMLIAAGLVRISSPGPAIFPQLRPGRGDSRFTILKFRTMVSGADAMKSSLRPRSEQDGPAFKMR